MTFYPISMGNNGKITDEVRDYEVMFRDYYFQKYVKIGVCFPQNTVIRDFIPM